MVPSISMSHICDVFHSLTLGRLVLKSQIAMLCKFLSSRVLFFPFAILGKLSDAKVPPHVSTHKCTFFFPIP
jgi:hypothetical protein